MPIQPETNEGQSKAQTTRVRTDSAGFVKRDILADCRQSTGAFEQDAPWVALANKKTFDKSTPYLPIQILLD